MDCIRDDHGVDRLAVLVIETHRIEGNRHAARAAHRDAEGVVAHDLEGELSAVLHAIQRSAVRMRDRLRRDEYGFEQLVDVALAGERHADLDELVQTLEPDCLRAVRP